MPIDPNVLVVTAQQLHRLKQNRLLLVELLQSLGRKECGANGRIDGDAVRCPFHMDRNPSGHIHCPDHRTGEFAYSCFGCDWNRCAKHGATGTGDVIHVARIALGRNGEPAGFVEAVQFLRRFRERIASLEKPITLAEKPIATSPAPDPALIAKARAHMPETQRALQCNPDVQRILWETRAVDLNTAVRFGVGYSPDEAGGTYWVFPIQGDEGLLRAVKLHAVDSAVPKSFWFPPYAKPQRPLYPIALQPAGPVVLCTGEFKGLAVISTGLAAIGVTWGESHAFLTDEMVALLRGRVVILVADNDTTGVKWSMAMASLLVQQGIASRRIGLGLQQPGADVADWLVDRQVVQGVSTEEVRAELLRRFSASG